MSEIRIAIAGVGNCASALIQGIHYYASASAQECTGLMHWDIGGYKPYDVTVVAAFDIDARKVGKDLSEAVFSPPNCTDRFFRDIPTCGVNVKMGRVLDGVPRHMLDHDEACAFRIADQPEAGMDDVVNVLKAERAELLVIYLPVGSEEAVRFYVESALTAGLGVVNCMPVFIASDPSWVRRFEEQRLPIIGDDIKSQLGATIVHRILVDLFRKRGVKLERTYQLNVGGNTDFLNMLDRQRLSSKKTSKTEAVQSVAGDAVSCDSLHVGPSDYVPWLKDNKICFIRMEGRIFGNVPVDLDLRLSVEDSPNSGGTAIDGIRCCKLALDRGQGGALLGPSAYLMKRPPIQYNDDQAYAMMEEFIRGAKGD
jgi:myo-inositol-1-phosphate synthase